MYLLYNEVCSDVAVDACQSSSSLFFSSWTLQVIQDQNCRAETFHWQSISVDILIALFIKSAQMTSFLGSILLSFVQGLFDHLQICVALFYVPLVQEYKGE